MDDLDMEKECTMVWERLTCHQVPGDRGTGVD